MHQVCLAEKSTLPRGHPTLTAPGELGECPRPAPSAPKEEPEAQGGHSLPTAGLGGLISDTHHVQPPAQPALLRKPRPTELAKVSEREATHILGQHGLPDAHQVVDVLGNARLQLQTQNSTGRPGPEFRFRKEWGLDISLRGGGFRLRMGGPGSPWVGQGTCSARVRTPVRTSCLSPASALCSWACSVFCSCPSSSTAPTRCSSASQASWVGSLPITSRSCSMSFTTTHSCGQAGHRDAELPEQGQVGSLSPIPAQPPALVLTILAARPWSFWPAASSRARAFIRLQYTRASRQVSWGEEGVVNGGAPRRADGEGTGI